MLDYFHTNQTCPMCSCSNNHTVWSTPIQREKNKRSRKVKTTIPPPTITQAAAIECVAIGSAVRTKAGLGCIECHGFCENKNLLESAAIEDGVRDFPFSPEISISLASFFVNCVFLFYVRFKFFSDNLSYHGGKKNSQKSNPSASPNPTS